MDSFKNYIASTKASLATIAEEESTTDKDDCTKKIHSIFGKFGVERIRFNPPYEHQCSKCKRPAVFKIVDHVQGTSTLLCWMDYTFPKT